jgi:predicted metal-dependent enzyme (double-stranded beta helix superfamily)
MLVTAAVSQALCLLIGSRVRAAMSFDRNRFVEDCVRASRESDAQAAVSEVLTRAVRDPRAVLAGLGAPEKAGLDVMHRSSTLTIFAAHWAPQMSLPAHDHRMWALIGLYVGREDNIFWRRTADGVKADSVAVLFPGDVAALPTDAIHSVTNPLTHFTGGIHIYGADFFDTPRSQWDPESLAEQPSNGATVKAMFERENERLARERRGRIKGSG